MQTDTQTPRTDGLESFESEHAARSLIISYTPDGNAAILIDGVPALAVARRFWGEATAQVAETLVGILRKGRVG